MYFKTQLYQLNEKIRKKDEKIKKIKKKNPPYLVFMLFCKFKQKWAYIKILHKNVKCNVNNDRSHGRKSIAKKKIHEGSNI